MADINTSTELATVEREIGAQLVTVSDLQRGSAVFSTSTANTPEEKVRLLNVLGNPEPISDNEGTVIELADIVAKDTAYNSADGTGKQLGLGVYIVDKSGKSYISVSSGIGQSVANLLASFGTDSSQWPAGLCVTPQRKNLGGGKSTWNLAVSIAPAKK